MPGYLGKCRQLSHFSLVCSSWVEPAQEALYRHIFISRSTGFTHVTKMLKTEAHLAGMITRLDTCFCLNTRNEVDNFKAILSSLISLRRCCITLPAELPAGTAYIDCLPTTANDQLKYLTIESTGWSRWTTPPVAKLDLADLHILPASLIHLDLHRVDVCNLANLRHPNITTLGLPTWEQLRTFNYENVVISISSQNLPRTSPTILRNLPNLSRIILRDTEVYSVNHIKPGTFAFT